MTYLKSQPLARIGTASKSGRPAVAAVSSDTDGEYIYVSGRDVTNTMKYKNVLENPRASFVVDDLETMKPWAPAGLRYKEKRTSSSIPDTWDPEPMSGLSQSLSEAGTPSNAELVLGFSNFWCLDWSI